MSKRGLTKIHHQHLEFVFDHEENKVFVRDHMYKIQYELKPTAEHDIPFMIQKDKYLD